MNNGLWTNTIMLVNVLTAGLLATNYFEPLADFFDKQEPSLTYVWDFMAIWLIFGAGDDVVASGDGLLRRSQSAVLHCRSSRVGGIVMAIWVSWVLVCFTTATLHTAPLARPFLGDSFRPEPDSRLLFGLDPDYVWLGWVHRESKGPLCRLGRRHEFDADGNFVLRYGERRDAFDHQLTLTKAKGGGGRPK